MLISRATSWSRGKILRGEREEGEGGVGRRGGEEGHTERIALLRNPIILVAALIICNSKCSVVQ
jgi:hypothetical protein